MKANELMIDDWVEDVSVGEFCQITSISRTEVDTTFLDELDVDDINPVPITPEILEKNGFTSFRGGFKYREHLDSCVRVYFLCNNIVDNTVIENGDICLSIELKYVHELQHALRLCNIDKDIEL